MTGRAPLTRELATFAGDVDIERLPPEVVHQAKRCLLDWFGCGLAGSTEPATRIARESAAALGPDSAARLVGSPTKVGVPVAALANGIAAHVLDNDDTYNPGRTTVHGSAPVWPAVMACAELRPTAGAIALVAFTVGFEVQVRIALAAGPAHYDAGWHVTGTVGHLGASVAASRVLGLDADQTAAALGLGAIQAAGLKAVYGSMGKSLHAGKAAMDGVLTAVLARGGFTSTPESLDGRRGFLELFTTDAEPARARDGLGATWTILEDGFKAYACGSLTHPCIDAVLSLRNQYELRPRDVVSIDANVHDYVITTTGNPAPATGLEGKFSAYHCMAVALTDGAAGLAQFSDERVRDPELIDLRSRVRLHHDTRRAKDSASVRITLADGRVAYREVAHNRGTPQNPMSDAELEAKFFDLAGAVIGNQAARRLADLCWDAENVADVTELMAVAAQG